MKNSYHLGCICSFPTTRMKVRSSHCIGAALGVSLRVILCNTGTYPKIVFTYVLRAQLRQARVSVYRI